MPKFENKNDMIEIDKIKNLLSKNGFDYHMYYQTTKKTTSIITILCRNDNYDAICINVYDISNNIRKNDDQLIMQIINPDYYNTICNLILKENTQNNKKGNTKCML